MGLLDKVKERIINYLENDIDRKNNNYSIRDSDGWFNAFGGVDNASNQIYTSFAASCINTRAEKIAEANPFLYRYKTDSTKKDIPSHPYLELYNTPNIYNQTGSNLDYLISCSLDIYGNAYIYYLKNRMNMPKQLIFLPPANVRINFNSAQNKIISYTYINGQQLITYSTEEIIHFKIHSIDSNLVGKPTINAVRSLIDTDYFQREFNKNFYKNDAALGMILSAPGKISEENFKRLQNAINQKYSGYGKSGKHFILDNGMTATRFESSQREAQTNQNRIQIRDEILAAFKVPKSVLGYTDDVNRANAESSRLSFMQNTIKPFSKNIATGWDIFIKNNYDNRLFFEYDFDMTDDIDTILKNRDINAKYNILTINELREQQGYTPINHNLN